MSLNTLLAICVCLNHIVAAELPARDITIIPKTSSRTFGHESTTSYQTTMQTCVNFNGFCYTDYPTRDAICEGNDAGKADDSKLKCPDHNGVIGALLTAQDCLHSCECRYLYQHYAYELYCANWSTCEAQDMVKKCREASWGCKCSKLG